MSQPIRAPEVEIVWHPSVRPFLTATVRQTLNALLALLEAMAVEDPAPVTRIEIRGYVDPEEGWKEVEVREQVALPAEAALDYWDRLGQAFDAWIDTLSPPLARVAREQIHLAVDWAA